MRLGIDFGTTRTRVAAAIEKNYPLIEFEHESGFRQNWYPSLIAVRGDETTFGLDALPLQYDAAWELCPSFKRYLSGGHPQTIMAIGRVKQSLLDWLTQFLACLRQDLLTRSSLDVPSQEPFQVMVGIPTNANSNQRFLTLEAFRRANFEVLGMINEPSAAGIEFNYRYGQTDEVHEGKHLIVYDLGGGTFDVSVIRITGRRHEVISSEGISQLGGDDFDRQLLGAALSQSSLPQSLRRPFSLAASGIIIPPLFSNVRPRLLHLCREAKESIRPNTRKISIDFGQINEGADVVLVPISQFYGKCEPLISRTIEQTELVLQSVLHELGPEYESVASVYLVGGSCDLPILARALREHFGKHVRRSPYPSAATAVGLAIAADLESGYSLEERFSRFFGVWRESEDGSKISFDPMFAKDTVLPPLGQSPLQVLRRYRPVHNIGHFRYLECSSLENVTHDPCGDIIAWDEVYFPYDPSLKSECRLDQIPIERCKEAELDWIEELYECDPHGIIQVTISNQTAGYFRNFRIR
ncbi:MAG: Hsp70 family protein [Terriglobia bacterium]